MINNRQLYCIPPALCNAMVMIGDDWVPGCRFTINAKKLSFISGGIMQ